MRIFHALAPGAFLVVVSDTEEAGEIAAAVSAGAHGYVHAAIKPELALEAFSFILNGGSYFPASAIRQTPPGSDRPERPTGDGSNGGGASGNGQSRPPAGRSGPVTPPDRSDARAVSLTGPQAGVLKFLRTGHSNSSIAQQLGMNEGTVKVHVRQIMRKLGAANRTQAVIRAMGGLSTSTH